MKIFDALTPVGLDEREKRTESEMVGIRQQ